MNPNRHRNIIPIIVMTAALLLQGCGNEPKRNGTEQAATIATAEITENLRDSEIPERPDNSENLENFGKSGERLADPETCGNDTGTKGGADVYADTGATDRGRHSDRSR